MATLQEVVKQGQQARVTQKDKGTLISHLREEDVISATQLTSLDSKRSTTLQRSGPLVQTRPKVERRSMITSITKISKCRHSNLTSSTPMKKTIPHRSRRSGKTSQGSQTRSWMSKSAVTCCLPLGRRCASEWTWPRQQPSLSDSLEWILSCFDAYISTSQ